MRKDKTMYTIKIDLEDLEMIREAAKLAYDPKKHRKDYGVSAFLKETALRRAKRLLKKDAS